MKLYGTRKKTAFQDTEEDVPPFKLFDVTYTWLSKILSLAMIYPNPKTDRWRLIAIPIVITTALPYILLTSIDICRFFMVRDLANLIRISTVSGPFTSIFIKITILYYKRHQAVTIINEIQRDYNIANRASRRIRKTVHENIKENIFYERFWTICVFVAVTIFPLQAAVMNAYSNLTEEENRYMITDLRNPYAEDMDRFASPYFEIMFGYTFYCCFLYFLHFSGYDSFMLVSIGHACLKFELFRIALEDAVSVQDQGERKKRVAAVVYEQNRTIWYVRVVQDTFQMWLGLATVCVLVQLCSCLFYIMEGFGFDERYATFTTVTIIYFYLICSRSHKLKAIAEVTPTGLYCCGWETSRKGLRWMPFMLARFQRPLQLSAFHFFVFDMQLFVFVVKTAYSMFTLLKQK